MMKHTFKRAALAILVFTAPTFALAQNFGINGSSCAYSTLQSALSAVGNNGTVFVRQGTHLINSTTTIDENVTLEGANNNCARATSSAPLATLNGTGIAMGRVFTVLPARRLTLIRMKVQGGRPGGSNPLSGGTIHVGTGGRLGLATSIVERGVTPTAGGCVYAENANISMILGSEIRECQAGQSGGGLHMNGGRLFVLDGNSISSNDVFSGSGGNIYAEGDAELTVNGSVNNGDAGVDGGGIALIRGEGAAAPVLRMSGDAQMIGNAAEDDGGAIYMSSRSSATTRPSLITSRNVTLTRNTAGDNGGAIHGLGADIELTEQTRVFDNDSQAEGGGIYAAEGTSVQLTGTSLDQAVTIDRNAVLGTQQALYGGGIALLEGSTLTTMFARIHNNRVEAPYGTGGGVRANSGTVTKLENTIVSQNRASSGGGVMVSGGELIIRAIFRRCTPQSSGGVVTYCSLFTNNVATGTSGQVANAGRGGAILLQGAARADIRTTAFLSNRADSVGGQFGEGAAVAQTGFGNDDGTTLLLNKMYRMNGALQFAAASVVYANRGAMTLRNSTFDDNNRAVNWEDDVSGTFNNNIVTNAATPAMTWPATTIGNCNVFAGASFAPLVGSDNENASFFLDDYAHPDQFDTVVLDQCANGPTFDIMGTRRPVNGSFDRGAVEYTP